MAYVIFDTGFATYFEITDTTADGRITAAVIRASSDLL